MSAILVLGRRRCDHRCWDAERTPPSECECVCEGHYHGRGMEHAVMVASMDLSGRTRVPARVLRVLRATQGPQFPRIVTVGMEGQLELAVVSADEGGV